MKRIVSRKDSMLSHARKLRISRALRYRERSFILQGKKIISECSKNLPIQRLFVEEGREEDLPLMAEESFVIPSFLMEYLSGLPSNDGFFAQFPFPSSYLKDSFPPSLPAEGRILILDALDDPGNVGSLLRTALAFSWDALCFIEPSVDPFNDKVLRASRGASCRIPIYLSSRESCQEALAEGKIPLLIADMGAEESWPKPSACALLLGNESRGVHPSWKGEKLSIPMEGMESLNVAAAGAIFLQAMRRV